SKTFSPFLLHGVTGSGKTEVYLKAIEEVLAHGGSALMLVPEIGLTPQLLSRVTERFDEHLIAVIHSGIGRGARYDEWRRTRKGDARIIIGARSAVFAPARNLRLIIVDEEHDHSYKQEERLVYNARDLAVVRGEKSGATVILGSATPGIQTYFHTTTGQYAYLPLTKRVEDRPLPRIEIIDMKDQRTARGQVPVISARLQRAIKETLEAGRQTLLFLNRRGFNTFLYCADCGYVFRCLNCSVSMTHHREDGTLRCHYCDYSVKAPSRCATCGGNKVRFYGTGTEKLKEEITTLFPAARVERMDSDSTVRQGSHERILRALDRGEIDILIGTQMITKGHDYPNVTLVGVVSADISLNIPDFRAAERTFQLLTQVSGRGGRGDHPGRVVIQTLNPGHYAVTRAREHDYRGFYDDEIILRKELGYPPFSRIVGFRISGTGRDAVERTARELGEIARECCRNEHDPPRIDVMGPSEAPIAKIKGRYRWHMLLKGKELKPLHGVTRTIMSRTKRDGVEIKVDVDPVSFM
ncbi:MAG: primosomal protein N', partial [Deltaproteobacteria bacterium]|nr:primosomal protein N' [Deltaproteobacteria bacterium]